MDIELATQTTAHRLALRGLRAVEADSYECDLEVYADGFSARVRFWPERWVLGQFLSQLREMDVALSGEALLQPMCEMDCVKLAVERGGAVWVSGEIGSHAANHLHFGFRTDQTVLAPLIRDLDFLLASGPPAV